MILDGEGLTRLISNLTHNSSGFGAILPIIEDYKKHREESHQGILTANHCRDCIDYDFALYAFLDTCKPGSIQL